MTRGFTLIELMVVIVIIAILTSLVIVGVGAALDSSRTSGTEAMLGTVAGALASYQTRWGDYPPTTIDELGGRAPNDLNNGVESLVACLSSKKHGPIHTFNEETYSNTDGDQASKNVTGWFFGDNGLREVTDLFGHAIIYFHHRDYAKPKASMTSYKFAADTDTLKAVPEQSPATKTYVSPDRFQLRSVGKDGKPGTGDDIRPGH